MVAVWTDVDGDGWQDLFVPTSPGRSSPFRNDGGSAFNKVMDDPLVTEPGNWGDTAWAVEVLRVEWTSGLVQELRDVPAKQFLTVTEPAKLATARAGQLQVQCWKGMAYRIETSPNLVDWTPLTTITNTQLCGGVQWVDPMAHGQSARFYRAVQTPDFAHPEALASTAWLEQHLADPQVRIVDCRYPQSDAAFKAGHIPGAVKVDVTDLADPSSAPRMLVPTKAQFESLMGRLGISNSTTVVAYDTDGGLWCARLWWALRYYGHENVKLLLGRGVDQA